MALSSNEFKIITFGDSNTGKTALIHRFIYGVFNPRTEKTTGIEIKSCSHFVDNLEILLNIMDFSGEPRFFSIFKMYCKGIDGAMFVFDMTDYDSIIHYEDWIKRIYENVPEDLPMIIVGMKSDLIQDKTLLENSQHIQELEGSGLYFQCSAKTGENVKSVFKTIVEKIYEKRKKETISTILDGINNVH